MDLIAGNICCERAGYRRNTFPLGYLQNGVYEKQYGDTRLRRRDSQVL